MDPSNPYFLSQNEKTSSSLILARLQESGSNYHTWSRSMTIALKSKNKLDFVNESLLKPEVNDVMFVPWDRCNTMVLSWLHNSIDLAILDTILQIDTAYEVWNALKKRYYQGDIFRISDLQEEICMCKQGDRTVTSYFTQLKGLWQELHNFRPIPSCVCEVTCTCNLFVHCSHTWILIMKSDS